MENYSPQKLIVFWRTGKPLEDAMWDFCDPDVKNAIPWQVQLAYQEMRRTGVSELYHEAIANECISATEMELYSQQVESQINDMLENIYQKICSGELIAFGFKFPIESDFPTHIPLHMWPPEVIDRTKSMISANDIHYTKVRINEPVGVNILALSLDNARERGIDLRGTNVRDKKVGRPSLKSEIIEAYEFLKSEDAIDFTKSIKAHTQLIQEIVRRLYPEITGNKGMQTEAIRRAISDRFHADKKNL